MEKTTAHIVDFDLGPRGHAGGGRLPQKGESPRLADACTDHVAGTLSGVFADGLPWPANANSSGLRYDP